ncbi:MAG: hypothetical protein ACO1QR_00095 [Chthoniobacteraceae bacterium]
MSAAKPPQNRVLLRGRLGFLAILALCWLVELLQLPHLLFGEDAGFNWLRILFRTGAVLAVWAWVHFTTKPLLARLHHLEEFIHVCSWCRKFGHQGNWIAMEDYFDKRLRTRTSHGICPECAQEQFADIDSILDEPATPTKSANREVDRVSS